jgi:hypothetical protein
MFADHQIGVVNLRQEIKLVSRKISQYQQQLQFADLCFLAFNLR